MIKMQALQKAFQTFWKEKLRLDGSQPVLAAVSGGVDSMVMATLLHQSGFSFAIAHCNFGLRGAESDADAAFVEEWADARNVPFFRKAFDTQAIADANGWGIQDAARRLRYEWFEEVRKDNPFALITTAHHADDSAETLLLNLFRGTGIRGLHGILPRQGKIVRPLLFASKKEILEYASENKIAFREDASNQKSDYTRNALRHHVLPAIQAQYPNALKAIAETAARVGSAEPLYQKSVEKLRKKLLEPRGSDFYLPIRLWQKTESAHALLYELLSPFGFSGAVLGDVQKLFQSQSGHYIDSDTHRILRHRDFLVLTARPTEAPTADLYLIEKGAEQIAFPEGKLCMSTVKIPENLVTIPEIALLNPALLEWPLVLRRWKAGDYFYPIGMEGKKKKVARFLIDQKMSLAQKEKVWVLQSGARIAWVVGMRLDERFKVKAGDSQILQVQFSNR